MDIKRALWTGALLWVLIFFEVSILMFGFKLNPGTTYYVIHYILAALLILLMSWVYFMGKKAKKGAVEGLLVGLMFVFVEIILDIIITVPLFVKSYSVFFNLAMFFGYFETIMIAILFGVFKK